MASSLSIQPNPEEVWRRDRGAVKERLSFYVGNEFLADVTFVVGAGAEQRRVPAHRFILSTCSWDFYNVTYLLQLDNNEIPIPDVHHDAFLIFLKYCYTGEILFAEEEKELLLPVLKLAHRFKMEHLVGICEDFIRQRIDVSMWCLWSQSLTFLPKESELRRKLLQTIAEGFSSFLANEGGRKSFRDLPLATVREIVSCDKMECNEMEVFDALMDWAKEFCGRNNISPEPRHLRVALKDVFGKIRFPAMKQSWFIEVLAKYPNLLTPKEISGISAKMNGKTLTSEENFPFAPRERTEIRVTRSSIETSDFSRNIRDYKIYRCFSDSLKIEGRSRHCSVYFKNNSPFNFLTGCAVLANKNQELKLRYFRLAKSSDKCDLPPTDSGQFYNSDDASVAELFKRYPNNSTHDVVFFTYKGFFPISPNTWYRLSCEFDVDLPHVSPDPLIENLGNLSVKKEKISFIPYLSFFC